MPSQQKLSNSFANLESNKEMQISDLLEQPMPPTNSISTAAAPAPTPCGSQGSCTDTSNLCPTAVYLTCTAQQSPMQSIAYESEQPVTHTSERMSRRRLTPLSIPVSEISRRIPSDMTPHLAAYPSPPTDILDKSAQENIISDILLNSPTASPSSNCPLSPSGPASDFLPSHHHHHPQHLHLTSPVSDTINNAFIYPQIGRPTSSKCERFMEFMKSNKLRRVVSRSPRKLLGVRRRVVEGVFKAATASGRSGLAVPLPSERISSVVFRRDSDGLPF
ncbi:hypothetical protein BJ741DRAFT_659108 [Chytriomyces cf. hyalinus JEL632]|nr:hypothetical protein BJ741DRAFT_659108 [Chytriomyces cf. hyalinus JEL632]